MNSGRCLSLPLFAFIARGREGEEAKAEEEDMPNFSRASQLLLLCQMMTRRSGGSSQQPTANIVPEIDTWPRTIDSLS